jgi:hypothetical protein
MRISGRVKEPLCPFCSEPFKRPEDIKTGLGNVFTGGKCKCGAAYVFDRSGHNLGEAYVDALVFACDGDWEKAWTLTPDADYKIESFHYDLGSHQLIESIKKGLRTSENLLFIRVGDKAQSGKENSKRR